MQAAGKLVIILGIIAIIVGFIMYKGWGSQAFGWLGHLPGDIRIENPNSRFYFPITTCILLSIIATVIFRLVAFFSR